MISEQMNNKGRRPPLDETYLYDENKKKYSIVK
jgi:hypothetical protein